jgi:hypothetical protein
MRVFAARAEVNPYNQFIGGRASGFAYAEN